MVQEERGEPDDGRNSAACPGAGLWFAEDPLDPDQS